MSDISISTIDEWEALSDEDKVEHLIELKSEARMDTEGGYPDDYEVFLLDGVLHVAVATVGYKGEPELIFETAEEFINRNDCYVLDYLEEDA